MMPTVALLVLFAAVLALAMLAVVVLTTYNAVVALQRRVDKAWANVDVLLKQRWDELPNLVAAVRGMMAYEQSVLEDVTRLRAAYSPAEALPRQAAVAAETSGAVRSLFAVMERYPDLKTESNVMALQQEIERLENLIAQRREFYNDSVYLYNARIRQVPAVMLAGSFGWTDREFFEAGPDEIGRPAVETTPA
jgi:LemA protein